MDANGIFTRMVIGRAHYIAICHYDCSGLKI
jgi:hypothetical protein